MKWILGLDLGPRSRGAVQFARWLQEVAGDDVVGVHVVEAEHLRTILQRPQQDDDVEQARAAARHELERAWAGGPPPAGEVAWATTVEDGLEEARLRHRADGLVLGRAGPRGKLSVVRLGHVARRVLRRVASPVVVAPPDLVASDVGGGAVVALTALSDDSLAACRFAAAIAARAGRPLAVAHVTPDPEFDLPEHLFRSVHRRLAEDLVATARERLSRWTGEHGIRPALATVLQGDVLVSALELAESERAPLLVVGARALSSVERAFSTNLGRDLAAASRVPVAIVPPTANPAGP